MIASEVFPAGFPVPILQMCAPLRVRSKFGLEQDMFRHVHWMDTLMSYLFAYTYLLGRPL
jgi:hypothetical protein